MIARRHWWPAGAVAVASFLVGYVALTTADPVYASTTSVLVLPAYGSELNLATEAQLVASTGAATEAARLAGRPGRLGPPAVKVVRDTSVLEIRYEAASPEAAQAGASAYAQVYLAARTRAAQTAIDNQRAALHRLADQVTGSIAAIDARIGELAAGAPELAGLLATRAALVGQSADLAERIEQLAPTGVNVGRTLQEAEPPATPVRPDPRVYLGLSTAAGLLLGAATAFAAHRLSSRVRLGRDITDRAGVAVLSLLPSGAAAGKVFEPRDPAGAAFSRLRNEVVAALRPSDQVILVTGAGVGGAATVVSANLAAALARAGQDVVLIGANSPEPGGEALTFAQMFDVADIPGLTDVLAKRTGLANALQRAPRAPRLVVITPGAAASAGGLLQSPAVREILLALRDQARYLVVEAPSTAAGPDAQSLAGHVDAAIVVAEARRTRHREVADAAEQLRRVGAPVLGAVLAPRVVAPAAQPARPVATPQPTTPASRSRVSRPPGRAGAADPVATPTQTLPTLPGWGAR